MMYDSEKNMANNGWLLNLVTDEEVHGKSLRDFVTHNGTIDLERIEQFDGEHRFGFKRRVSDQFHHHIEDMVDNVHEGICDLFNLLVTNVNPPKIELVSREDCLPPPTP